MQLIEEIKALTVIEVINCKKIASKMRLSNQNQILLVVLHGSV